MESNQEVPLELRASKVTAKLLLEVFTERQRQDSKWGQQNHPQMTWLGILAEEFGEAAKDINDATFTPDKLEQHRKLQDAKVELIQVAAVCLAMIESMERNELKQEGGV